MNPEVGQNLFFIISTVTFGKTICNCSFKVSLYNLLISEIFVTDIPEGGKFSVELDKQTAILLVQSYITPWIVAMH